MRDTWIGSGVLAKDVHLSFYCLDCDETYDLDGQTDDGGYIAYADCPRCGDILEANYNSTYDYERRDD